MYDTRKSTMLLSFLLTVVFNQNIYEHIIQGSFLSSFIHFCVVELEEKC